MLSVCGLFGGIADGSVVGSVKRKHSFHIQRTILAVIRTKNMYWNSPNLAYENAWCTDK